MEIHYFKPVLAAVALLVTGSAIAAGNEKFVPLQAEKNAPGTVRTETCARPAYPPEDLEKNHQGAVTLRFLLDIEGKVKQSLIAASSGYPTLDEAARSAISTCSFHPARVDGKPVEAWTAIQYVWKP